MADVSEYIDNAIKNAKYGTLFMLLGDMLTDEECFEDNQEELFHVIVRLRWLGVEPEEIRMLLSVLFTLTHDRAVYDDGFMNKAYAYSYGWLI